MEEQITEQSQPVAAEVSTDTGVQETSPSPTEESSASEQQAQAKPNRYQKLANENRQFREQLRQKEEFIRQKEAAIRFHDNLSQTTPQKLKAIWDILAQEEAIAQGQANKSLPELDYNQYDPAIAARLRTYDESQRKLAELENWKAELDRREQLNSQQGIQKNMETVDRYFDRQLMAKGILDKNGQGDAALVQKIERFTLAELASMMDDPRQASQEDVDAALESVLEAFPAYGKITSKKTIVKPSAPPSGSNRGAIPTGKKAMTDEERIMAVANSL